MLIKNLAAFQKREKEREGEGGKREKGIVIPWGLQGDQGKPTSRLFRQTGQLVYLHNFLFFIFIFIFWLNFFF